MAVASHQQLIKRHLEGKKRTLREENADQQTIKFLAILRTCAEQKDIGKGIKIHYNLVQTCLLARNCYVAASLVNMYVKCGESERAAELLDEFPARDVVSWSALIAGYAQEGYCEKALRCYECMQHEGLCPDAITFTSLLKACGRHRLIEKGEQIHAQLLSQRLLVKDVIIGTALVDMYAKCACLGKAIQVLDELPLRNVVSWNSVIAGFVHWGHDKGALSCFDQMLSENLSPNTLTFTHALKACGNICASEKGEEIHEEIIRHGLLGEDIVMGNALVDMYIKCGALAKAKQMLDGFPLRNVVTWNSLITGYIRRGQDEEALRCFALMQKESVSPNSVTFICILKTCASIGAGDKGKLIHDEIVRQGLLGSDIALGTSLIDMYAKLGMLTRAANVLDELSVRNVAMWNALIIEYAKQGQGEEAFRCFEWMRNEGCSPDTITFISILKACACIRAADMMEQIHSKIEQIHIEILKQQLFVNDITLGNTLIDVYVECDAIARAIQVFEELPLRDLVTWNSLIAGYAHFRHREEALYYFKHMQCEGLAPDTVTYTCILKACSNIGTVEKGMQIHSEIERQGLLEEDVMLGSALVEMYAKCGALDKAEQVCKEMSVKDIALWNALIAGYAQHGQDEEALRCFHQLRDEGLLADIVTYTCILKACGSIGTVGKDSQVHNGIMGLGWLGNDIVMGTALVDMYAKLGSCEKAAQAFDNLPGRDVFAWSALITGYVRHHKPEEALRCFERMKQESLAPDNIAYMCILKACGILGVARKGEEIHNEIERQGLLEDDLVLVNILVEMYSKCGVLAKAAEVIDKAPVCNVVTWSALILGYARHGQGDEVLRCFTWMQHMGVCADAVFFSCLLSACGRSGLADKAQRYYINMSSEFSILPALEHHSCMVNLLARAGNFDVALVLIKRMPYFCRLPSWHAVLGACREYRNLGIGKIAFYNAVQTVETDSVPYQVISSV